MTPLYPVCYTPNSKKTNLTINWGTKSNSPTFRKLESWILCFRGGCGDKDKSKRREDIGLTFVKKPETQLQTNVNPP